MNPTKAITSGKGIKTGSVSNRHVAFIILPVADAFQSDTHALFCVTYTFLGVTYTFLSVTNAFICVAVRYFYDANPFFSVTYTFFSVAILFSCVTDADWGVADRQFCVTTLLVRGSKSLSCTKRYSKLTTSYYPSDLYFLNLFTNP